jgi:hypothetical protein
MSGRISCGRSFICLPLAIGSEREKSLAKRQCEGLDKFPYKQALPRSAGMAELADAADSKSADLRVLGVRLPLPAPLALSQVSVAMPRWYRLLPALDLKTTTGRPDCPHWPLDSDNLCHQLLRIFRLSRAPSGIPCKPGRKLLPMSVAAFAPFSAGRRNLECRFIVPEMVRELRSSLWLRK